MRSDTRSGHVVTSLFQPEGERTPTPIWTATWLTIALLLLMVVLGALFLNGFFSSITGTINERQTDVRAQP